MYKNLSRFVVIFTLSTFNSAFSVGDQAIEGNQNEEAHEIDQEDQEVGKKRAKDFKKEKIKKPAKKIQKLKNFESLNFEFPDDEGIYATYRSKKLKFNEILLNDGSFHEVFRKICIDLLLDPVDMMQPIENAECFDEGAQQDLLDFMALIQKIIKNSTYAEKKNQQIRLRPVINIFHNVVNDGVKNFKKEFNMNNVTLLKEFISCYIKLSSSIRLKLIELLKPTNKDKNRQLPNECMVYLFYIFKEYARDLDEKGQFKLDEALQHMCDEFKTTQIPIESIKVNNFAYFLKFLCFIQKIEKADIDNNNELNLILSEFFEKNQEFVEIRDLCYEIVEGKNVLFSSLNEHDFSTFVQFMLHMMKQCDFEKLYDMNNLMFFVHKLMGCASENIKRELLQLMVDQPSYDAVINFLTPLLNPRDIFRDENYNVPQEAAICFNAFKDVNKPAEEDGLKYLSTAYDNKRYLKSCSIDHSNKSKEFLDVLNGIMPEVAFFKQPGQNIVKKIESKPLIRDLVYEAYNKKSKPETVKKIFDFFGVSFREGYHYQLELMKDEYKAKYVPKEPEGRVVHAGQMLIVQRPQLPIHVNPSLDKNKSIEFIKDYQKQLTNERKRSFVREKMPELCAQFLGDNAGRAPWLYNIENAEDIAKDDECIKKIQFIVSELKNNSQTNIFPESKKAIQYLKQIIFFGRYNIAISYQMFYAHRMSSDIMYALGLGNMVCHPEQSDASLEQRARVFLLSVSSVCDALQDIQESRVYKTILREFVAVLGSDTLCMEGKLKDVDTWYSENKDRIKNAQNLQAFLKRQESFDEEACVLIAKNYGLLLEEFLMEDLDYRFLANFSRTIQNATPNARNLDSSKIHNYKMGFASNYTEEGRRFADSAYVNSPSAGELVSQFIVNGFDSFRTEKEKIMLPEIYSIMKKAFVGKSDRDGTIITEELIKSILADTLDLDFDGIDQN
ncbi:MAG: hypothetical protein Q8L85_04575 [Alphaproteobacteria bacterium]|nr:hypothetical protein [Alphaproteobacteria bacterium]